MGEKRAQARSFRGGDTTYLKRNYAENAASGRLTMPICRRIATETCLSSRIMRAIASSFDDYWLCFAARSRHEMASLVGPSGVISDRIPFVKTVLSVANLASFRKKQFLGKKGPIDPNDRLARRPDDRAKKKAPAARPGGPSRWERLHLAGGDLRDFR